MPDLLRRSGPMLAVGGLVLLNLVLIGALVLRSPEPTTSAVPVPGPTLSATARDSTSSPSPTSSRLREPSPSPSSSTSPSSSPSPSTSPTPAPTGPDRPPTDASPRGGPSQTRVLAASSDRIAWRAEPSPCGQDATVEVTTDGGRRWTARDPGIGSVVRLKTYGTDAVFAIGADDRCRPTYAWTTGPDEPWQQARSLVGDIWFRRPNDLNTVHAPGGKQSRPCGTNLVDLAGLGTYDAAVLCRDGRLRTNAEGRGWKTVAARTKTSGLNADDSRFVLARTRSGCDGVVVQRFDATATELRGSGGRCRTSSTSGSAVVAIRGDVTWVWRGDQVTVFPR